MKTKRRKTLLILILALLLSTFRNTTEVVAKWEETEEKVATIVSFGDTLVHSQVYKTSYNSKTDQYDFTPMFEYVRKYMRNASITIGNSESPFAGKEKGYSGYPCFNAPEHLAIDLREAGVDILTTSNNHCLDKGYEGLCSTLDYLDNARIKHVGTSRTKEEQENILFENLNGIKTAFLSFTYGTNGIPIPDGKEFCVNLIDENLILEQISKAKQEGAECIVASMHWGIEYQTTENSEQDRLAEFLISNDVDIVLGCHPHVLQPMKMLKAKNESGEEKEGLVIFSQGNFFSAQTKENTRNTAIFQIEIRKNEKNNKIRVAKAEYIPLYVYDYGPGKDRYKILDLEGIISSYEQDEGIWDESMYNLALKEVDRCYKIIGPEIINY